MLKTQQVDDITTQQDLKKSLLISEQNFRQLFNSSAMPQWIYDAGSFRLLYVNDAAYKQYGYSAEEFLTMTILDIIPAEERQKSILYNEFMKTTDEPFSVLGFIQSKSGSNILVETTYTNIDYNEKQCVLLSAIAIAERNKLQEKISSVNVTRQQKIALSTINNQEKERHHIGKELHDNINQLLAAAKMYLGLARSNSQVRVEFITEAGEILEKAIDENRSLSNSLVPSTLKLIGFRGSLQELLGHYLTSETFNITLSFDEELEALDNEIQISIFRMVQAQLNNIAKQGQAQNVMIRMKLSSQIEISIKDDSMDYDSTMKQSGTGISDIRNRVELYNGTVEVFSEPQEGYTLRIRIPLEMSHSTPARRNVLIVEDDPDDQAIMTRAFAEIVPHYHVACLNDGTMLVDLLKSFSDEELPCLIVLDYNMPLLNGLETLKLLELDHRFKEIPKIIYSSSSQNSIKNLCYSANAKAYVTKGTTMEEIKENIQEMLSLVQSNNIASTQ
jgi:PAS domain S-box-containing protein